MAAVELEWIPETLYNTAISAVVDNYSRSRRDIRSLPENIQFDVYYKVRTSGRRGWLAVKLQHRAGSCNQTLASTLAFSYIGTPVLLNV